MPTAGPERPTSSRRSRRSSGITRSTSGGSSSAASRWGARGLAPGPASSQPLVLGRGRRRLRRDEALRQARQPARVPGKGAPRLRRRRLRRKRLQRPDRRLWRRGRPAAAGVDRHRGRAQDARLRDEDRGAPHPRRRDRLPPRCWRQDGAPGRSGLGPGPPGVPRRACRQGPQPEPEAGQVHHLHAEVQPGPLAGDRGDAGALSPRGGRRGDPGRDGRGRARSRTWPS